MIPNRLRALMALRDGELCVCQLIELLKLAPPTASKHMTILKQAGLVVSRKYGLWVYYSLGEEKKEIMSSELINIVFEFLKKDRVIREDERNLVKIKVKNLDFFCREQQSK